MSSSRDRLAEKLGKISERDLDLTPKQAEEAKELFNRLGPERLVDLTAAVVEGYRAQVPATGYKESH